MAMGRTKNTPEKQTRHKKKSLGRTAERMD